mmetsp:Transcript_81369/g.226609  ORF Transcript_81369/g.226609 Transcript_81369/m.226609 type:complete len:285 (-) Transcript_81369:128-982(-)
MAAPESEGSSVRPDGTDVNACKGIQYGRSRSFRNDVGSLLLKSMRANRVPAMVALALGLTLLLLYYGVGDATRPGFESLARVQEQGGLLFSTVSTAISAGFLPSLLQIVLGLLPRPFIRHCAFNTILWAALGCVVDRLYLFQAFLFGASTDVSTVVKKVLFDQFVWNPFVGCPFLALVFRWRDHEFSCRRWSEVLQPKGWLLSYCCMLFSCWCTWIPGTSAVYSFPSDLQMPAFNVILLMYSSFLSILSLRATAVGSTDDLEASSPGSQNGIEKTTLESTSVDI